MVIYRLVLIPSFITNKEIHQHYTRNANKLHKKYVRSNALKYTLRIKGIDIQKNVNPDIKKIQPYYRFKESIRKLCLDQ